MSSLSQGQLLSTERDEVPILGAMDSLISSYQGTKLCSSSKTPRDLRLAAFPPSASSLTAGVAKKYVSDNKE